MSSEGLLRGHGGGGRSDRRCWEGAVEALELNAMPVEMRLVKRRILAHDESATIVSVRCRLGIWVGGGYSSGSLAEVAMDIVTLEFFWGFFNSWGKKE